MTQPTALELLTSILTELKQINNKLSEQSITLPYTFLLTEFPDFNWGQINATVVERDQNGATIVRWQNQLYARRFKEKYNGNIWFSRKVGEDYEKLIRFVTAPKIERLP